MTFKIRNKKKHECNKFLKFVSADIVIRFFFQNHATS